MLKNKSFSTSYFVVMITLGVLALFPIAHPTSFNIHQEISPLFKTFPTTLGDWTGTDSKLDERTYEILETKNILSRVYVNKNGASVHLLLVGSSKDRRVAHPPEVCYLGSNYNILNESETTLEIDSKKIPVKRFSAEHERDLKDKQKVLYLYKIGARLTTNYYTQQLQFAMDKLTQKESLVLLIRIAGSDDTVFTDFLSNILKVIQ